jgi:GNAT superfamily N-acetyltransferase
MSRRKPDTVLAGVEVRPLTPERWHDLEVLFRSAAWPSHCWCMEFRCDGREFSRNWGEGNREALRRLAGKRPPGLLAYSDGVAVGWCAVAPKEEYTRFERSWVARAVEEDEPPEGTWSVVCFFIHRSCRGRGVAKALLAGAVEFAAEQGAPAIEGYPVRPKDGRYDNRTAFPGTFSLFQGAQFQPVDSAAPTRSNRIIMLRTLAARPQGADPARKGR